MKWRTALAATLLALMVGVQPAQSHPLTQGDADGWLDGLLPYALHSGDIAGSVVIVVKDGQVLTERGYGYADVSRQLPMDPRETLIRPGSVSKLFTWTAVMQLVERGALDLDTDVNRYLDFPIPPFEGKPITLRNAMTHTTGFEESLKDLGSNALPTPLADYIKSHVPQRIYPPGRVPAYSNYATALAGYIVQRVSGVRFEEYVQGHILTPLGMRHSSFRQPLPPELAKAVSSGYTVATKPPGYYEYIGPSPAGSMATTADDMGRFMLAHLQNGRLGDTRILSEQSAILMHAAQPRIYPALNAMALGFYETSRNGHRIIAHNGGTQYFHSDLHLFMEDGVGLFIVLNSSGTEEAATKVLDAVFHGFADRYFPAGGAEDPSISASSALTLSPTPAQSHAPALSLALTQRHAALMAGAWENSRRSAATFWSIASFLGPVTITDNGDGTLTVPIPSHGSLSFRETAPFVWTSGAERMQALVNNGRPVMIGFGMAPPAAFLRQPWLRSATWLAPALLLALAVLTITVLSWPTAAIARRVYKVARPPKDGPLYALTRIGALAILAVSLATLLALVILSGNLALMSTASDGWILALEASAWIVFPAATLVGAWNLVHVCRRRPSGWLARGGAIAFLASCSVMLWAAAVFHLMTFRTIY